MIEIVNSRTNRVCSEKQQGTFVKLLGKLKMTPRRWFWAVITTIVIAMGLVCAFGAWRWHEVAELQKASPVTVEVFDAEWVDYPMPDWAHETCEWLYEIGVWRDVPSPFMRKDAPRIAAIFTPVENIKVWVNADSQQMGIALGRFEHLKNLSISFSEGVKIPKADLTSLFHSISKCKQLESLVLTRVPGSVQDDWSWLEQFRHLEEFRMYSGAGVIDVWELKGYLGDDVDFFVNTAKIESLIGN